MWQIIRLFGFLASLLAPSVCSLSIPPDPSIWQNADVLDLIRYENMTSLASPGRVTNLTGAYGCIPSAKYSPFTRRPTIRDCGGAIRRLPSGGDIHVFSARDVYPYYLPQSREVGSCRATVGFVEGVTSVRSSWLEIGLSATEMLLGCIKGEKYTGGHTTTGDQDKLLIDLAWIKHDGPDFATASS